MKLYFSLFGILVFAFILSACASPTPAVQTSSIEVTNAWVRASGGMDSMSTAALFMNIQNNGAAADTLLKVNSDVADMAQVHLSEMDANGVASMHEVEGVEIPAGGSVELKSGSYHVMLMGLTRDLKAGDTVTFTLTFKNAGAITIEAQTKTQ
ncbi:MAG: copper chaperone PCu(A)C [Chloroflexota bacterium]